ncbi:MAG: ammonium transporter [Pirellulales bacterium]
MLRAVVVLSCSWLLLAGGPMLAQDTPPEESTSPAAADQYLGDEELGILPAEGDSATGDVEPTAADSGDHAWMLVSTALVLMMTAPGLALFYCGLVRKKNVLSVMMQCFFLMGLMTVIWVIYGYSLAFAGDPRTRMQATDEPMPATANRIVGNWDYVCMGAFLPVDRRADGVQPYYNESNSTVVYPMEGTIPRLTYMMFQGMFFIITPALICGAFAERMKFSTMCVFLILWGTFVYIPLCHAVWDNGLLAFSNPDAWFNALDFAGGTVVHISSGVSALVCALVLGRRLGFGTEPMPPHNLTYTVAGAALLWVGWFGFNAGSALQASNLAASAFVATHLAAAAGVLGWTLIEWLLRGKPTVLGACSGAVAGLVCITPAAGYVQPMSALLMGLAAGLVCYFACTSLKVRLRYDDSLDAFGVHGVGGTLGALLTGVFATQAVDGHGKLGLLEFGDLLGAQAGAAAVTIVYAAVMSFVLLKILDAVMGLRVTQQHEIQGLDLSQHGEEGYIFL